MRVLHVDSGREYRGGQNQVRLLARELAREPDVQQLLVTKGGSELARRVGAEGVPVRRVPWRFGLDPAAGGGLRQAVLEFRPHILHAHDSHALGIALAALGGIELWQAWMWLWPPYLLPGHRRRLQDYVRPVLVATRRVVFPVRSSRTWRRADHIVAISQAVRAGLLADGVPAAVVTLVPSGIDPQEVRRAASAFPPLEIRSRLGLAWNAPLAVNLAALEPPKDQLTLVRSAARARELRPDLHWIIAGEGRERRALEAEIRALGVGDRVHLAGHVGHPQALLREAHVCVMSSREEGLGTAVLEALALGKPVVAASGGGLSEVVPGEWLVPVGDADALARKVVRALDQPAPSPPALPPQFTASAMATGVLAVYRSLV